MSFHIIWCDGEAGSRLVTKPAEGIISLSHTTRFCPSLPRLDDLREDLTQRVEPVFGREDALWDFKLHLWLFLQVSV